MMQLFKAVEITAFFWTNSPMQNALTKDIINDNHTRREVLPSR